MDSAGNGQQCRISVERQRLGSHSVGSTRPVSSAGMIRRVVGVMMVSKKDIF
jgi:hypothetical protein